LPPGRKAPWQRALRASSAGTVRPRHAEFTDKVGRGYTKSENPHDNERIAAAHARRAADYLSSLQPQEQRDNRRGLIPPRKMASRL